MKLWTVFQFELKCQLRQVSTCIYLAVLFLFPISFSTIGKSTDSSVFLNAPSFLIFVTVLTSVVWLLMAGAIAGHAAARDVESRMHPLTYTAPVSKAIYLGGRFMAAFLLNALIHLAIPAAFFLSFYIRTVEPSQLGPFRPEAFLTTYCYLSLPLAFVATACQFSIAVLERSAIVAYVVSILLFPVAFPLVGTTIAKLAGNWELVKLIDPIGFSILGSLDTWTAHEKNTRLIQLEGMFLWNRLLWIGIAAGLLAYSYARFGFVHAVAGSWWSRLRRKRTSTPADPVIAGIREQDTLSIPQVKPAFGFSTHLHQTAAIGWASFKMMLKSRAGLSIIGLLTLQMIVFAIEYLEFRGVPQYPTTMNLLGMLTAPLRDFQSPLIIIPILIAFYAGELVWKEREWGLNKISDAAPVSEWSLLLGKFLGIGIMILVWLGFLMLAGVLIPITMSYSYTNIGVLLKALFGFQLISYLLFALLALVVHVVVNQKYLGHGVVLLVYMAMVFAGRLGIEHNLLIYASDPGWAYTDMRGFGPYLEPWLWFKVYWVAWAALLAVAARLLWVRSITQSLPKRLQLIGLRLTRPTVFTALVAAGIVVLTGGYIFYNTNVLNDYKTTGEITEKHVAYEQAYGKYKHIPQPILTGTSLDVAFYPGQQKARIRGTYQLVNKTNTSLDSIHVATAWELETTDIAFSQAAVPLLEDKQLGHHIYKLKKPLQPGDSLSLRFLVTYTSKGFPHKGIDLSVVENGSYFIGYHWLPAVGYQKNREIHNADDRKKYKLTAKSYPSLYDTAAANRINPGQELIKFEAVVSTDAGQLAIAPGELLRKWTEGKRSFFHYATSAPIRNTYSFFSASYNTHKASWKNPETDQEVAISLYYHPEHGEHIERIIKSIQASFTYYTKKFGPYPYSHITIIERSGYAGELNAEPTTIDYGESFIFSNIKDNPWALDLIYFPMAHEIAHQWWGAAQLLPAHVEGGIVVSETLANYSALQVVEEQYGKEHAERLLAMWRKSYEIPRSRATAPLLRAADAFIGYRKGPFALHALSEYIGKEPVNRALSKLLQQYNTGKPPFATSLNLYQELQAVTPDSLHYLLEDYFEKNVYWQLKTLQATTKQLDSANWQVTLQLQAKKLIVDSTGAEIDVPMNDWVEVGIFAGGKKGAQSANPLYLQKHRIRSGEQTITITVPEKPVRAGIDPNYLLMDLHTEDNVKKVQAEEDKEESFDLI